MSLQRIGIALGFDNNFIMPATVTITSLLYSAKGECCYDIYCIVEESLPEKEIQDLKAILDKYSPESTITFMAPENIYRESITTRNFTSTAMYFRLMLPNLLPHLDKILYLDTDIAVCDNLLDLYNMNIDESLLVGVLDAVNIYSIWRIYGYQRHVLELERGKYLNSGVLLMNLNKLREANLEQTWLELSKKEGLCYPDQDILNYTCKEEISFCSLRYNYCLSWEKQFPRMVAEKLITQEELAEAQSNPAIYHYITSDKPWLTDCRGAEVWWKFAEMTKFYDELVKTRGATVYSAVSNLE
jgi:lipopolysaccharide biosynthesis glycosyltransferase